MSQRYLYLTQHWVTFIYDATGEAAILMLRSSSQAKDYLAKLEKKYNKGKALGILTHKLGRAIYFMLKNKKAFDMEQFFTQ